MSNSDAGSVEADQPPLPKNENCWRWQLANRITTAAQLSDIIELTEDERSAIDHTGLPFAITPYYAKLISNPHIRKCVVPSTHEMTHSVGEDADPLGEESHSNGTCVVHRYPDRCLFMVTKFCSTFCRYCTRSRLVSEGECISDTDIEAGIAYIRDHAKIRDVIVSGGDPLTLSTDKLDRILTAIRSISHVEVIRIGTKVPVVLPQRIDQELCHMLMKHHPLFVNIHFTHLAELTPECVSACSKLANSGIPLGSQTVLLKGVNDDATTMRQLFQGLLKARVIPRYLYQCDPVFGSSHFRTDTSVGLDIIRSLRGWTSGMACPRYVIDAPGGGGKICLEPNSVVEDNSEKITMKNFRGELYSYPKLAS